MNQESSLASSSIDQASMMIPGYDGIGMDELGSQLSLDRNSNRPAIIGQKIVKRKQAKNTDITHMAPIIGSSRFG